MSTLGEFGGLPFTLGGDESPDEIAKSSMLKAIEPYLSADDAFVNAEARAHASAVRVLWDCDERIKSEAIPERMMDALPEWEAALRIRVTPEQNAFERRAAVAAKLRGMPNNAEPDIIAALDALLSATFVDIHTVAEDVAIVFWPSVNPGPPGFEWSTNRRLIAAELTKEGSASNADFARKLAAAQQLLDATLPVDMKGHAVAGSGAVFDLSVFDEVPFAP